MADFIFTANIAHFKDLLGTETDAVKIAMLRRLSERAHVTDHLFGIISVFEECPQQPPQFAVPGCLATLLEIIRDIHRGSLDLDRTADSCVQMRHLPLDIQAFGVRIEDQCATIRMGDLRASNLTVQLAS
ncbi:hypothetical protein HAP47_0016595 [Bradyrhizobium sp. 41S5]|uniref:hypothetical protein n=1 Tax=Bradyrhizobium sp. 41S5 TaxID=1404443 RepID=UPI00156A9A99|nr:hypothetical protein [Bradyrhizobium sp. 41S5]UFX48188.1 hypothetical protein HAP47_0016595 [Bradyrhizobium sp. 41S5]